MAIEMRVVGLGVAKNVFKVHGIARRGETSYDAEAICEAVSPPNMRFVPS
jgi:hypothetical protein